MAKNTTKIPYTELQERVIELARVPENAKRKARGVIQDVYTREIPSKFDWNFLITSSGITTIEEYNTGTLSINTGDTTVTFGTATIDSSMNGRKLKISGNPVVYNFTMNTSTGGTLNPPFEGSTNATASSYSLFQPTYSLASDFDRFPKDGGLYKWEGGKPSLLEVVDYQEDIEDYSSSVSVPQRMRMTDEDTAGCQRVELNPPPSDSLNYGYDYIKQVPSMKETSAGTVTVSAKGTTVTGVTTRFTDATTGDWFRVSDLGINEDSSWYKVLAIQHDSSLTLSTAFENSGASAAKYCISSAPEFPDRLHPGILYGGVRALTLDQTDESFGIYQVKLAETLSDAKRIHVTRVYSKSFKTVASEDYLYRR